LKSHLWLSSETDFDNFSGKQDVRAKSMKRFRIVEIIRDDADLNIIA
jgi:hypothetical protein